MSQNRSGKSSGAPPLRVLYIAGAGRSGSTIIDNILGQIPGVFSAGEVTYFWQRLILEGRRCGCGRVGSECPIWSQVLSRMGDPGDDEARWMVAQARAATRIRHVPSMVAPGGGERLHSKLGSQYVSRLEELYATVADVAGTSMIVDSSKFPGYGRVVSSLETLETKVMHVVRDARAVAYSWLRRKPQPDTDDRSHMMQRKARTVAPRWMTANIAAEALFASDTDSYVRFRYEDFAAEPEATLNSALTALALDQLPEGLIRNGVASLEETHTISGNPSRFATGPVKVRVDDEWKTKLTRKDARIVTSLTLPLLARYRYL